MGNKLTVAIIGCGDFAWNFVNLFKRHPYVDKVYVCDKIRKKAEDYSRRFGVEIIDSYEEALRKKEINADVSVQKWQLH